MKIDNARSSDVLYYYDPMSSPVIDSFIIDSFVVVDLLLKLQSYAPLNANAPVPLASAEKENLRALLTSSPSSGMLSPMLY